MRILDEINSKMGRDFTVSRRHKPDYLIILFMSLLMLLGLVTMYAIGPQRANVLNNAYGSSYSDSYFFIKQSISVLMALVAFFIMAKVIPYTKLAKYSNLILISGIIACLLLALAGLANWGIAKQSLGATRWFDLGILGSVQPAELLKFGLLIYLAGFLGSRASKGQISSTNHTLWPLAVIVGIALFIIVILQRDLGTGVSIVAMVLTMLLVGRISWSKFMKICLIGLVAAVLAVVIAPHRIERVKTFLKGDETSISDDDSYQVEHAKIAIGTGGLFGVGIGNSVQATGYLPEAINDSVFAIMGETFGFIGLLLILLIFTGLFFRLLSVMDNLIDYRLKLLVAGVFGWLGAHVVLNIASMTGLLPLTGITLPLLSFGGTSMVSIAAILGLVFQLSHFTSHSNTLMKGGANSHEDTNSRRRVGRSCHASSSSIKGY